MRKAFTLVELLAVITILVIMMAILIPTSIKMMEDGKDIAYELTVKSILASAQDYVMDNKGNIEALKTVGLNYDISLETLATAGYLKEVINNPQTNTQFNVETTIITIQKKADGSYIYSLGEGTSK